jgi:hypothetical protein
MKTILLIPLLLVACALPPEKPYTQPGMTSYDARKDEMECVRTVNQEAELHGMRNNMLVELYTYPRIEACMRSLGYSK